jgi:predicted permease
MSTLLHDLRYAARQLFRSPGFALPAILTLALGIGATTAIFSVVYGVILRPLPYPHPERLTWVQEVSAKGNPMAFPDPDFDDLNEQSHSFQALAAISYATPVSVTGGLDAVRSVAVAVSRDFFRVMGASPIRGRTFQPDEQSVGAAPSVIVSNAFWKKNLGGGTLAGKTLKFDNRVFSVVGVMPEGFSYPEGVDLWIPRELEPALTSRTAHNWAVVGRLADGVTMQQARSEAGAILRRLKAQYGDDMDAVDASVKPLRDFLVGGVRTTLLVLLGASAFLLLIAVANVSNLMLVRLTGRRREIAVRVALGAGRMRLTQQLLAESLVLGIAGGVVGVVLAYWGTAALLTLHPGQLPRLDEVGVSGSILLFALALSIVTALGIGAVAAVRGAPRDLRGALASGGRTLAGSGSGKLVRDGLVVAQVGLTLVLLAGAGLMARSLLRLLSVDTGFRTEGILVMNVAAPSSDDEGANVRTRSFEDRLLTRLRSLPEVEMAGGINAFPLQDNAYGGTFLVLNRPDEVKDFDDFNAVGKIPSRAGHAGFLAASDGYFEAMGIPVLRGRAFSERDAPDAPITVAVISETLAKRRWPAEDPLGKLLWFGNMDGDMRALRVVGVVRDVRSRGLDAEPQPFIYVYSRQRPNRASRFHIAMRVRGDAASVIPVARQALLEVDPTVPPTFHTVEEIVGRSTADRRFVLFLLGVFGAAALLLAVAGIYSVVSYLVAQRTREIGVRMAFGARATDVARLVVGRSAVLALVGIGVGLAAALVLTRLLASQLYGITATDPVAYAAGAVLLAAVALIASYLPARRATRVDPMVALRAE